MPTSVSSYLLRRLTDWGVRRVFGFPGDGINGIVHAFSHFEDRLKFVQVRHEEMAAFMACAHAKFTGQVGVCMATSGPGAIHLLNGLYDAKMDHQPVVAIVGQSARTALGGDYQHPDRVVVAMVGDGAMQMNGINELITIGKYWKRWKDPRLVVLVLNNRDLNMVTWEQRAMAGDAKLEASQVLPDFPYARYAES